MGSTTPLQRTAPSQEAAQNKHHHIVPSLTKHTLGNIRRLFSRVETGHRDFLAGFHVRIGAISNGRRALVQCAIRLHSLGPTLETSQRW